MVKYSREYYEKLMRDNNYDPIYFGEINFGLGRLSSKSIQMRWLCHHNADKFSSLERTNPEKSIVTTGIGLSGPPHIGTLSQILKAIMLQRAGLNVQFVLGDLDAYNGKSHSLKSVKKLASRYKNFIVSLGFDVSHGILRDQFDALDVLRTSYLLGKFMDDEMFLRAEEDLHSLYEKEGKVDAYMTFRRKLSLALMTADFFDLVRIGFTNILIMLGVDEHQYVRFAWEVWENLAQDPELHDYNPENIGGIYSSLIKGFNGYPKMSKSFPNSSINLEMPAAVIEQRIMEEEGDYDIPEDNVVYQMMAVASDYDDKLLDHIYKACKKHSNIWRGYKKQYVKVLLNYRNLWEKSKDG